MGSLLFNFIKEAFVKMSTKKIQIIGNIATKDDVENIHSDIGALEVAVDSKASQSTVDDLSTNVAYINSEDNETITDVSAGTGCGASYAPDCHAEYFQVTEDGVASLKPEYRGQSTRTQYEAAISDKGSGVAGSKNTELPEHLVIPEIVDGILVDSLADGTFSQNMAIKAIILPKTISVIPDYCFEQCLYLTDVYNTENITKLGARSMQCTGISRAYFPNLKNMGTDNVFYLCGKLVYADIGSVTDIPDLAFERCSSLNCIKNSGTIKTVGKRAFRNTVKLKRVDFIPDLTSIGNYAFYKSKVEYDWNILSNCTFGTNATSAQLNPTDIWSNCTFTACQNPIPTRFSQQDPRWVDRVFTTHHTSGRTLKYSAGCQWMCVMHIYCGINNITLSSATEFETIVDNINPTLRNTFESNSQSTTNFMNSLGLNATYYSSITQTSLQAIYNALSSGGYACVEVGTNEKISGHTVVIYGVNENGEFLVLDSESDTYADKSNYLMYSLPYKNMIAPGAKLIIVTP